MEKRDSIKDNIKNDAVFVGNECDEIAIIKEGNAKICHPPSVFYNKVQEFNRDLTIHSINTFLKYEMCKLNKKSAKSSDNDRGITILDALSATGLRSIRYALECDSSIIKEIIANDISCKAIETINANIMRNNVQDKVKSNREDASLFMYLNRNYNKRFTIVDIDPYGCPSPFLDAAVQCVSDGGLLMVTSTDMAILCGNHSETCHAKYGSVSLKAKFCHEMALRIILRCIESHANRYGRYIIPLISLSIDFYARVFVQIFTSPFEVKRSASKLSYVYHCNGCESFELQRLCSSRDKMKMKSNNSNLHYVPSIGPKVDKSCHNCGRHYVFGGPIWTEPIHSVEFVENMKLGLKLMMNNNGEETFGTFKRLNGVLHVVSEELSDAPLYYCLDRMCRVLHCRMPPMKDFRSAILNGGYRVSYSHAYKTSIKTDAPNSFLWDILREWCKKEPPKVSINSDDPAFRILGNDTKSVILFDYHESAEPFSKEMQLLRYQVNPQANWGPKTKPNKSGDDKRKINQGKRTKRTDSYSKLSCKRISKKECDSNECDLNNEHKNINL